MPERSLKGTVAVVTGSARGAGRMIALELVREGANVVVADRTDTPFMLPGTIHTVADEIKDMGGIALPVKVDLRQEDEIVALRDTVLREFGTVDVVINNAGIQYTAPVWELPTERWDQVMAVNPRATFLMCKHFLPALIEKRAGAILNISSLAGRSPQPHTSVYAASKAAVDYFTLSLAAEVRPHNIAVNCLAPTGVVDTEGTRHLVERGDPDQLKLAEPAQHYAKVAVWLVKQEAASFTGHLVYSRQLAAKYGICKEWCCMSLGPLVGGPWRVKWEESLPQSSFVEPDERLLTLTQRSRA
jgi:NAD(P)-dependent dehydrogenase (short-subunit alcohol dehydrogenase family)